MDDKFILGMMMGFIAGAIVMHVSPKAQELMEKGKQQVIETVKKI